MQAIDGTIMLQGIGYLFGIDLVYLTKGNIQVDQGIIAFHD